MTASSLSIPYDRILEEARLKIAIARQHLEALSTYGLTAAWIDDLEATADATQTIPPFGQQQGELKSLTAVKNAILRECVQWGQQLRLRLELAFEQHPPTGMQFPTQEWRESRRNDARMIALMPSLIKLARQHAPILATTGQTATDLAQGQALYQQLKAANEAQEQYKFARTTTTTQRRELYRKLYAGVNRINQLGQAVYGSETPNGQLFRSNWGFGRKSRTDKRKSPGNVFPGVQISHVQST